MTLVVDASIAAKWFVEEAGRAQALQLLDLPDRQTPDLIVAEVANVVWKKAVRGQVNDGQARAVCAALPRYFQTLHPSEALVESAIGIGLALRHPVYDCLYLACAMRLGTRLVTADRGWWRHSPTANWRRWLCTSTPGRATEPRARDWLRARALLSCRQRGLAMPHPQPDWPKTLDEFRAWHERQPEV